MKQTPVVEARKIYKIYQNHNKRKAAVVPAVNDVSFSVHRGEILGLVGESGSGKTTLGKIIIKLLPPTSGKLLFGNEDITHLGIRAIRPYRKKIQMIFQNPYAALNPGMTVRQIIEEPIRMVQNNGSSVQSRLEKLLQQVNLNASKLDQYPRQLSGGERRRVGLARILALSPEMIVLDEPVAALDISIKKQIIDLLLNLQKTNGMSLLWISHDLITINYVADRIAILFRGHLVEIVPKDRYKHLLHPYSKELYNSSHFINNNAHNADSFSQTTIEEENNTNSFACPYLNRCIKYLEYGKPSVCREKKPLLKEYSSGHQAACHLI